MVEIPILKFLLSDDNSLHNYLEGKSITFENVKRHIVKQARSYDRRISDQHYRLEMESATNDHYSLGALIEKCLSTIAEEYLNFDDTHPEIKIFAGKQTHWHQILTFMPPLLIKSACLANKRPLPEITNLNGIGSYYTKNILPNFQHTALAPASWKFSENQTTIPADLHIHLNGSAETDWLWQDFLSSPKKIYKNLKGAYVRNYVVADQLEQESHLLHPYKYYNLLIIARKLRVVLFDLCLKKNTQTYKTKSLSSLLKNILSIEDRSVAPVSTHPFRSLIPEKYHKHTFSMATESLLIMIILKEIKNGNQPILEQLFHFYILIYGLTNRLLVQQLHQNGFGQFQKHTLNSLRDLSEETYHRRFFQMFGNQLNCVGCVEGRVSPKLTQKENAVLFKQIERGWNLLETEVGITGNKPLLRLVPHFIKREDLNPDKLIRHKKIRCEIWKRGKVLQLMLMKRQYKKMIVGIDAAASEFDAPPEVFAPVFRKLRNDFNIKSTFHVGEDFVHPLSGMRAIFEAVNFIGLGPGDRIGHGTAMGVDIEKWKTLIGDRLLIRRGEWLDNMLFVIYLHNQGKFSLTISELSQLEVEIHNLTYKVYDKYFSLPELIEAWLLRRFCPILMFEPNYKIASSKPVFDFRGYHEIKQLNISIDASYLFQTYHSMKGRKSYETIEAINPLEIMNEKLLEKLQLTLLSNLAELKIVIETLPTSNVRISIAKDFSEYHLIRWEKWRKAKKLIPEIVIGTDDTGIFATNLLNEYACVFEELERCDDFNSIEVKAIIQKIITNSTLYNFRYAIDNI